MQEKEGWTGDRLVRGPLDPSWSKIFLIGLDIIPGNGTMLTRASTWALTAERGAAGLLITTVANFYSNYFSYFSSIDDGLDGVHRCRRR